MQDLCTPTKKHTTSHFPFATTKTTSKRARTKQRTTPVATMKMQNIYKKKFSSLVYT